jgi:hypothetical protein
MITTDQNSALSSAPHYKGAQALVVDGMGVSGLKCPSLARS